MKKLIFLLMVLSASWVNAEPAAVLFSNLTGSETTTQKRAEAKDHTVFCNYTNVGGSATAVIVNVDGSIDNDNFVQVATHTFTAGELTARKAMFHVLEKPISAVLGNISSITDTGTTYVGCKYWPYRSTFY